MPRVAIPATAVQRSGTAQPALTNGDATNDHYIEANDGRIMLEIVSTDAGAQTVEVETPGSVDGLAVANLSIAVGAGLTVVAGPFPPAVYNQPDGSIYINPSVSNTLDLRAYRI